MTWQLVVHRIRASDAKPLKPQRPLPVPFPGLTKLNVAFFNVNGALSIGLFLFTLGDLLLG